MLNKLLKQHQGTFYTVFRVLVGLLFWQHGAQKLLGLFGGTAQPAFSMLWVGGIIEFFAGIMIVFGLLTQVASALSALYMLVAYFMVHATEGLIPIVNKGELALLYFACFLVLFAYGSGKLALDNVFKKKHKKKK